MRICIRFSKRHRYTLEQVDIDDLKIMGGCWTTDFGLFEGADVEVERCAFICY